MSTRILALVGSLRAGSYNRQLAEAARKHAPDGIGVDVFDDLGDVAFYNEDIDHPGAVAAADRLRVEVECADALLLVTPEYNGTIPASLKNAIDWISRPYGAGAISGKPLAVVGASTGRYGGRSAHHEARRAAIIAGASVLDHVTLSVPHAATRFATIHPADDDEIAHAMPTFLAALAAAVPNRRQLVPDAPPSSSSRQPGGAPYRSARDVSPDWGVW